MKLSTVSYSRVTDIIDTIGFICECIVFGGILGFGLVFVLGSMAI
jgi:hypothetical protein